MTSVRADMVVMTSAGDPAARAMRERVVQSLPKLLSARDGAWGVGLCQFFFSDVDRSKLIPMMVEVR